MNENDGKKALHVSTFSGWYRFEQDGKQYRQTKRDLTYWTLTCMSVDSANPQKIYAGSEHSGLFYSENGGAKWQRAEPNTPKMMLFSALALDGGVMVGTIPSAVYRSKNGGWEELTGVRINSAGANFPPSPELQSRTRYLTYDPAAPARLYAGIEVGGMLVSDDSGYSWKPANTGLTDMDIHEVLASEANPGMVYLACGEACFRSLDRAAHWEDISPKTHDYGTSVAEDKNGTVYIGCAKGRPNLWIREEGANAAIFRSSDKGATWEKIIDNLNGGVMHMCPAPDGNGMIAGTSDGSLLVIDDAGVREIVNGLPFVTCVELGA
jgi:ligand-binding sensor domain-containing protein